MVAKVANSVVARSFILSLFLRLRSCVWMYMYIYSNAFNFAPFFFFLMEKEPVDDAVAEAVSLLYGPFFNFSSFIFLILSFDLTQKFSRFFFHSLKILIL